MNKEHQVIKNLSCLEVCDGDTNRYTRQLELVDDALPILEGLIGKKAEVKGHEDDYCYVGEDDPEDQSHVSKRLSGVIVRVDKNGIRLNVESGERIYSVNSCTAVNKGEIDIPFFRHNYAYKSNADIDSIQEIVVGDIVYRPVKQ
ncbi:MAG: hypothetical protein WDA13_03270 [Candidatus Shapirobacteria bacterium]|jgi:hypothetical protein